MNELLIYLSLNLVATCAIGVFYRKLIFLLFSKKSIAIMFIAGIIASTPTLIVVSVKHIFKTIKRKWL